MIKGLLGQDQRKTEQEVRTCPSAEEEDSEGDGAEDLDSGGIPLHGRMWAWAGEACPGDGRTGTLGLCRMPGIELIAAPGPMTHSARRRDI